MADTLDVLTLAEGHAAVNIPVSNTDHDTELAQAITAVSRIMDAEVGPVVVRTITAELHDATAGSRIWLQHWPVTSVTTVRTSSGSSLTTLSAVAFGGTGEGYYAPSEGGFLSGALVRRSGGYLTRWDGDQIEVTYVAGRYANTASVDARFKACAASILRRLWKRESGTWAQSSTFFEQADQGVTDIGFFRVAKPIIDEMLRDQRRPPAVA